MDIDQIGWQIAGIERSGANGGHVSRLFRPQHLRRVSRAWVADGPDGDPTLYWREHPFEPDPPDYDWESDQPWDTGILDAFIGLVDAPDEAFVAFAKQYSPLELCDNGLPVDHSILAGLRVDPERIVGVPLTAEFEDGAMGSYVPLEAWRGYAREARSALNLAAAIYKGDTPSREDWESLIWGPGGSLPHWYEELTFDSLRVLNDVAGQRSMLSMEIDWRLELAGVRPAFEWAGDRESPDVRLAGGSVYGAVMRHLIFAIAKVDGLVICSGCGRAFTPSRRPRKDHKRSWCPDCKKTAANRAAQRRRRKRLRGEAGEQ